MHACLDAALTDGRQSLVEVVAAHVAQISPVLVTFLPLSFLRSRQLLVRRIQYAKLWKSLIMADVAGIKAAAVSMNAGDSYALFAGMLTQRPWEKARGLSV